uniref:DNA/RNA-binding protein Kin17 WH-like domain-containing protein n=1 Tax=Bracon brevicornis TaxID=1563983 RepID=A0A6V7M3Q3_9HYME
MGKHEPGTPKYIANKIKSKGLQKLRWYCQMCEKQCRDENGFKCHTMSESHHRQLLLFADNQHKYMDQFSKEFSHGYLNLLKRQFGTKRVPANRVYQEYIADRGHVHMNATIWLSLTAFVKWLGRTGKCVVDETEKGWFVTYIDRDPETIALQEKKAKKERMDKDDEERMMDFIGKQVEQGKQEQNDEENAPAPLERATEDERIVLELKLKPKTTLMGPPAAPLAKNPFKALKIKEEPRDDSGPSRAPSEARSEISVKRERVHDDDDDDEVSEAKKSKREERGWLHENLVVKLLTKCHKGKYYKAKGVVQEIMENGFVGKVKLTSPTEVEGHVLKLDQEHLETVIPAIGRSVMVIQGKYRGKEGIIKKVRVDEYSVDVELDKDAKYLRKVPYEDVCKFVKS